MENQKWISIYKLLEEVIKPNQTKIPSQRVLSMKSGLKANEIRSVLDVINDLHLIYIERNKGTFINHDLVEALFDNEIKFEQVGGDYLFFNEKWQFKVYNRSNWFIHHNIISNDMSALTNSIVDFTNDTDDVYLNIIEHSDKIDLKIIISKLRIHTLLAEIVRLCLDAIIQYEQSINVEGSYVLFKRNGVNVKTSECLFESIYKGTQLKFNK